MILKIILHFRANIFYVFHTLISNANPIGKKIYNNIIKNNLAVEMHVNFFIYSYNIG